MVDDAIINFDDAERIHNEFGLQGKGTKRRQLDSLNTKPEGIIKATKVGKVLTTAAEFAFIPQPQITHQNPSSLRACVHCNLIKTMSEFEKNGCDNCADFLDTEGPAVDEYTSPNFEGMVAMINSDESWVASWQRMHHSKPGVYAINVKQGKEEIIQQSQEDKQLPGTSQQTTWYETFGERSTSPTGSGKESFYSANSSQPEQVSSPQDQVDKSSQLSIGIEEHEIFPRMGESKPFEEAKQDLFTNEPFEGGSSPRGSVDSFYSAFDSELPAEVSVQQIGENEHCDSDDSEESIQTVIGPDDVSEDEEYTQEMGENNQLELGESSQQTISPEKFEDMSVRNEESCRSVDALSPSDIFRPVAGEENLQFNQEYQLAEDCEQSCDSENLTDTPPPENFPVKIVGPELENGANEIRSVHFHELIQMINNAENGPRPFRSGKVYVISDDEYDSDSDDFEDSGISTGSGSFNSL